MSEQVIVESPAVQAPVSKPGGPLHPWLFARLHALQFDINCLSSVAIEYPALRSHPLLRNSA